MDLSSLDRLVDEQLTAAALMVPLAAPLSPELSAAVALDELERCDFDLAFVDEERLRIVTRRTLSGLNREELVEPLRVFAESPRRDRIIDASLPLRRVAGLLLASRDSLLVVGAHGVTHIITAADFTGVAGSAAVLSFLLEVDRAIHELLSRQPDDTLAAVSEKQRADALELHRRAEQDGIALDPIQYLSMRARFRALRRLGLARRYGVGSVHDHRLLVEVRNQAAHSGLHDADAALRALATAEWLLGALAAAVSNHEPAPAPDREATELAVP